MLKIFYNELDAGEFEQRPYECLLTEWLAIREQYPTARLYRDCICVQNDVTPKTREQAMALMGATGDYQVLCHAGDPVSALLIVSSVLAVGAAVYTYMNMPDVNTDTAGVSGSPNNSLAQRQNKHRVNERVPDIYGKVKSLPDLISPVYRYYKNNVQVEECLLSLGTGHFEIDEATIKEGETPIKSIEGASVSIYEPGQQTISATPQIKIGAEFDTLPLVTKQVSSIDGKQTLIPPNSNGGVYKSVAVSADKFKITNGVIIEEIYEWDSAADIFMKYARATNVDITHKFSAGEKVIIQNAIFGNQDDATLSGNTDVAMSGVLTIASRTNITNPSAFKKIRISSLSVNDPTNGNLDLAGEYKVDLIVKAGGGGTWIYEVTLSAGFVDVNSSFSLLTQDAVTVTSALLTDNDGNIDLSGIYTVANVTATEMTLVDAVSVNSDWARLDELTAQQVADFLNRKIVFRGTNDNYVGWYYAGSNDSTGLLLNFLAANGIYEGENAKEVAIEIEYQMVIDGLPSGPIYKYGEVMRGKANNRDAIGVTVKRDLPSAGTFRFRAKRNNDNGNAANLIDDVVFESAYSYYTTKKAVYEYDTIVRLRRMAIGSGTNASEFNLIAHRKLPTATGFKATSDFADIVPAMATDPHIGRMSPDEVDTADLRRVSDAIADYFGTPLAREFNYTFDDKYASYQEMVFSVADAVFCTARRENGLHYFNFERETPNSLLLFNHRNMKPESLSVTESFGIKDGHDGLEFKWRDPKDNYAEAVIKLPDELQTNYKAIEVAGVTNSVQAHFLANRAWNKLKYNRKSIEFTAYGEADLVTRMDRIAVVDSTVPIMCSGEIDHQDATILTLGYPADLDPTKQYVIQLQIKDGIVDVVDIVRQIDDYRIEIARIPLMPLVTQGVLHTTFSIVEAQNIEHDAYLIDEKSASSLFESNVTASSYSWRYYQNDSDFKNGLITV